jgi:hypothetical protein
VTVLEFTIRLASDRFSHDDEGWLAQETDLFVELSRDAGAIRPAPAEEADPDPTPKPTPRAPPRRPYSP